MESPDRFAISETASETESPVLMANSKENHERLFRRGLRLLGIGLSLMAVSFGLNFLLCQHDGSFIPYMYAITSAGTVCIIKGLMDIMG
jgi:hypothetical protein